MAAAVSVLAVLITGCASTVDGAGVRGTSSGSVASGTSSSEFPRMPSGDPVFPPSAHVPSTGGSTVTGPSSVRPMPPIPVSSNTATPAPDSSAAPGSSTASTSPSPAIPPSTEAPGATTPTAAANPVDEFTGATAVDPSKYHGTVTDVGFASPSGNITCGLSQGILVCQIDKFDYTPPKGDCGPSGWGFNFELGAKFPQLICAGDVESGGPTLAYGRQITVGKVRCVSRQDGITCQNTYSGDGFRLSRAEYVFFGPNEPATTVNKNGTLPPPSIPAAVVGQWQGHGRMVTIDANGLGTLNYRAYKMCSDDPTPPCDKLSGNAIVDGGHIVFVLNFPSGSKAARGVISQSNDPKTPVGDSITVTASGYNLDLSIWPDTPFCAANTPSSKWNCGA